MTFHNRARVSSKAAPDLTVDAAYVTPDVQPTHDDQQILNYVETTAVSTGILQVARSTTSETTHGRYADSKTYLVQTDAEALDRGNWIVTNFAEPSTRYGTLTINLYNMPASQVAGVLAAIEVDAWLRVTGAPSQTPGGTTIDVVVEGYSERISGSEWTLTCNVVSRSLFNTLILDNATYGVLDSTVARLGV